ncbi:MAG: hypothetical protein KatS3mg110_3666 [Pirellulaceae bacterium]|nr:MAG: hypothetical protein KatS3mg110_3666 [Pirellulaceae bacterium]
MFLWLVMVILFSILNLALGVVAAAFFGLGPLRDAWFVYALSYPCIPPPRWLAGWLERLPKPPSSQQVVFTADQSPQPSTAAVPADPLQEADTH